MTVLGCGGATPGVPKPPPRAVEARPKPAPTPAELQLEPVAEPPSLLAVARMEPSALDRVLPGSRLAEPLAAVFEARELASEIADGEGALEVAVALDSVETLLGRGPDVAVSFPVQSRAAALGRLQERESAGVLALERRADGTIVITFLDRPGASTCWLARSLGPTPLRLVCGEKSALSALGAYLARGLPLRSFAEEGLVVVEAWPARLARHAEALKGVGRYVFRAGGPGSARAASVLLDDGLELFGDIQRARARVALASGGLRLEVSLELSQKRSWISRTLTSLRPSAGVRAMFDRLPRDSELAGFFSSADPARTGEARAALVQWLRAEVGPGYQSDTLDLVARTFLPEAPVVYAQGDASGFDMTSSEGGYAIWQRTLSTFGWHLVGYAEPAKTFVPKLDAGMKAYNSGDLSRLAYSELERLCPGLGKIVKRPVPRELPRGSALYELEMPGKFFDDCAKRYWGSSTRPAPSQSMVVVMVPDEARTWIGFGPDRKAMIRRMAALGRAAPDETLGSALPLALLGAPPDQAGGFTTLRGIGGLFRFATMGEHWQWRRSRLGALPNAGQKPIAFALRVKQGAPSRIELEASLSEDVLRDLERL